MSKILAVIALLLVVGLVAAAFWLYTPDASRPALETKYNITPQDYRVIAGLHLNLRDTGPPDGPVVILLHGFGASLQTFDAWAKDLSAEHRVIRYDLPGFGLTGPDPTGDYSDARGMAVLLAVMDTLGVARASLIGNSMGGRLAWQFAAAHPDRVSRLVLISPDGFASPGFAYGKAPEVPFMVKLLPYLLPRALVRMSIAPAYADPAKLDDARVDRYRDMMLVPGVRKAILARMTQTVLEDPEPLLRTIRAPTLLLWGDRDAMIPLSNAADYMRDLVHGTLVVLPGLGHVPHEEAPEIALAPVKTFLAEATPDLN